MTSAGASDEEVDFQALWQAASTGDGRAQYELGLHYNRLGSFSRGRRWLERAAGNDQPKANTELAVMHLHGIGTASDPAKAALLFADSTDPEAKYQYANLLWSGYGVAQDTDAAARYLIDAARLQHPEALNALGIFHALSSQADSERHATTCFRSSALAGNAVAQYLLSLRIRKGAGTDGNLAEADYWLGQAVRSGKLYVADGFPEPPTVAPVVHVPVDADAFEAALTWPVIVHPTALVPEPGEVRCIADSLSEEICVYLMNLAAPYLKPSLTVHPETGAAVHNEMRSSSGMSMHRAIEDIVVLLAKERLAHIAGMDVTHAEPFAFLRYRGGEEYRPHFDYIEPDSGEADYQISQFGQRVVTVFAYLTTAAGGGQTHFPNHDRSIDPIRGQAVCFRNTRLNGSPDESSLHASLPVTDGEKWLATLWLRERPFQERAS